MLSREGIAQGSDYDAAWYGEAHITSLRPPVSMHACFCILSKRLDRGVEANQAIQLVLVSVRVYYVRISAEGPLRHSVCLAAAEAAVGDSIPSLNPAVSRDQVSRSVCSSRQVDFH